MSTQAQIWIPATTRAANRFNTRAANRFNTRAEKHEPEQTEESAVGNWIAPVFLLGPVVTALAMIAHQHAQIFSPPDALGYGLCAVVGVMWSPFSLSLPGAILREARDNALPEWGASSTWNPTNLVRLACLTPYLMFSRYSRVRLQQSAAVLGWLAGLVIVAAQLR